METIKVLVKDPIDSLFETEVIKNDLKAFQDAVGGYIETITLPNELLPKELRDITDKGLVIIVNEEGRLKGMPQNCELFGYELVGPVVIAGFAKEDFTSCPIRDRDFNEWYIFDRR